MSTAFATSQVDDWDFGDAAVESPEEFKPGKGNGVNKPGMYHVMVVDVKLNEGEENVANPNAMKTPHYRVDLEILAGTEPDQAGKKIYHSVYLKNAEKDGTGKGAKKTGKLIPLDENGLKPVKRFAYAFGLVDESQVGQKFSPRFSLLPGRQAIVKVEAEEYEDRNGKQQTSYRINWGNCWRLDDPDVADVPRDAESAMLAQSGGGGGPVNLDDL